MTDLTTAAERWREAQRAEDAARQELLGAVIDAYHSDGLSEYQIAAAIHVDRGTIRRWLGKG